MSRGEAKKEPTGAYEVGYCRPPEAHRFKKGHSGNLDGRPPKKAPADNAAAVLDEPLTVKAGGVARTMPAYEAALRNRIKRALTGRDVNAALDVLAIFEKHGVIKPSTAPISGGGMLRIPRDWNHDEWHEMLKKHGPPPWPGKRSGLPDGDS